MPDALEVVVGDTAAHATCAAPAGELLDFARPVAQVTVHNAPGTWPPTNPVFDGTVTVVPNFFPTPLVVKK